MEDVEKQKKLLDKIITNKMTVRELEEEINPKPKQELNTADLEKLLKKEPVPINENSNNMLPDLNFYNLLIM